MGQDRMEWDRMDGTGWMGQGGWDEAAQLSTRAHSSPGSHWGEFVAHTGRRTDKCSFSHQPFAGFPNKCVVSFWLSCFRRATCEHPKGTKMLLEILRCLRSKAAAVL